MYVSFCYLLRHHSSFFIFSLYSFLLFSLFLPASFSFCLFLCIFFPLILPVSVLLYSYSACQQRIHFRNRRIIMTERMIEVQPGGKKKGEEERERIRVTRRKTEEMDGKICIDVANHFFVLLPYNFFPASL